MIIGIIILCDNDDIINLQLRPHCQCEVSIKGTFSVFYFPPALPPPLPPLPLLCLLLLLLLLLFTVLASASLYLSVSLFSESSLFDSSSSIVCILPSLSFPLMPSMMAPCKMLCPLLKGNCQVRILSDFYRIL